MENRKIQFRSKACNLHLSAYPGHSQQSILMSTTF